MSEIKARNWYDFTNQAQFTGATLLHKFRNPNEYSNQVVLGYLIWKATSSSVTISIGNGQGTSGTLTQCIVIKLS